MSLLGGLLSVKAVTFLSFSVFLIAAVGYLLGKITIKGVNLGTAGVFIVALLYGCFFNDALSAQLIAKGTEVSFSGDALKIVENVGLIFFVTSVGFIAGPNFFGNLKKNLKSYVFLGLVVIVSSVVVCVACILIGENFSDLNHDEFTAMMVGLLSGSLTSTPAFSATKAAVAPELEDLVSVGHGISYLFGVVGVVLFVQIVPKMLKANMEEEVKKITIVTDKKEDKKSQKLIEMDEFGFMAFSLAAIIGVMVGAIKYNNFSLTTTGGCLLVSLIFGHFGKIGKISLMPSVATLKVLRELGLMLFLIGAGVAGGAKFVEYFEGIYFVYGVIMTVIPMFVGYFAARYILKLPLLNNLGSLTGGMTSTPALGTLINTADSEEVATSYAATYPIALVSIVIGSQLIIMFC